MKNKILFLDTETGGLNPAECSLLSVGLVVWYDNKIIDSKEIFIKHDLFKITPDALKINQIDILSFLNVAIEPKLAINEILDFCVKHFEDEMPITLGGHNTNFDINFIKYFFNENKINFSNYFSHRFIDTASILKYLYYAGKLEEDISSADKAFKYFNIQIRNRHTALDDAEGTAILFSKLIELVK